MPKKTVKPTKTLIQTSIKTLLKKKADNRDNNDDVPGDDVVIDDDDIDLSSASLSTVCIKNYEIKKGIKIPEVFKNPNDITQWKEPYYKVSEFCVLEFRHRTNFEAVELKRLYHGSDLVSTIISKPHKRLYSPIIKFKYKSAKEESYLKNLALLPNIKSKQDLRAYVDFYKQHGLKECYVNMNKDNPAKEYSDKMIENFRKTNSDNRVWKVMRISNHEVLNSYYNHIKIKRPKLYSRDFTLDSLLMYSNIESIAKLVMENFPKRSQDLQKKLLELYDEYRYNLIDEKHALRYLQFNPYYEIVDDFDRGLEVLPQQKDDAQPSTSKYIPANTSFEFKKKPKVAVRGNSTRISHSGVDLTINEDQLMLTDVVCHEEIVETSSCNSPSILEAVIAEASIPEAEIPEAVINEDAEYDDDDSDDEEDKLETISELLMTSNSFLLCVRDIYQTQKYLTATDWRVNMNKYVLEFLKENISLDIVNYVKVFNKFTKEQLIELINDYLSCINQQKSDEDTTNIIPVTILPETSNDMSCGTTSVESLNVDPIKLQMKQEPIRDVVEVSSDSEPVVVRENIVVNKSVGTVIENIILLPTMFENNPLDVVPSQPEVDALALPSSVEIKKEQISDAECQNTFSEVEVVEIVDEIIEIDSDSEKSESMIYNEFNTIDDKLKQTASNSDIYLKSAEQGDTQQETIMISDPIPSCSTTNDSKLENSYNLITHQAHIDDQRESKKRKMAINTMNRIELAMNEPAAKRVANKENVTVRKNTNLHVVMASKPSTRNIYMQDTSSDEILQPLPQPGNIDFHSHIDEVLNHEYSVFLSSQIIGYSCDDEQNTDTTPKDNKITMPTINFTTQITPDAIIPKENAACFYVNILGVRFHKDAFFILTLNIQQFKFYSIDIENENIKILLNLNDLEWTTITDLLNLAIKYNYVKPKKGEVRKVSKTNSNTFTTLLDKFFDTSTAFKTFYLNSVNNSLIFYNADGVATDLNIDLTSTISPSILEAMKRLKATGTT
ncbi:unnamed protein product [Diamesa hyperborea]